MSSHQATKLIVILGSTAVGKTKLSIELAKLFNGEIISADSMQVYKGLDIITNKVTKEEKNQIPHHLIDVVSPLKEFTVLDFKKQALDAIVDLTSRNKVPVIVGGTNYFIEALLWDFLIDDNLGDSKEGLQNRKEFVYTGSKRKYESESETEEHGSLHQQLMKVDPERANQLHPNNIRKISRSLQIYHSTGQTHSGLMKQQQSQTGSSRLSGPLRFPKSLVFWLTADQDVLDKRISKRVDGMIEKGLVEEIRNFYENYVKKRDKVKKKKENEETPENCDRNRVQNEEEILENSNRNRIKNEEDNPEHSNRNRVQNEEDNPEHSNRNRVQNEEENPESRTLIKSYEEGLFQAIGFKEFHAYLTYDVDDKEKKNELLKASLDKLKQITIKYSKKQIRWVQNRFLGRPEENSLPVYDLDASDVDNWDSNVLEKAKDIATSFMNDEGIQSEPCMVRTQETTCNNLARHVCEVCNNRLILGDNAWDVHLKSKRHRKMKASQKRRAQES